MKFCSTCGSEIERKIPDGDNRLRHMCVQCGAIHYQNPNIVTGCLVEQDDGVLMCKRAIEPRKGLWTLPAGFLENDETTIDAAVRETWEEAKARVEVVDLFTLFNLPHVNQVYVMFRARFLEPDYGPGEESLEVEMIRETDIPWEDMAFPVISETLKLFFEDKKRGNFKVHTGDMIRTHPDQAEYDISML